MSASASAADWLSSMSLDGQFQLLDEQPAALGRRPELLPPQLGEQELEPLGLEAADQCLAPLHDQRVAQRQDHRMRVGKVGRERVGERRHAPDQITTN